MTERRDRSFMLAFCASLAVHAGLSLALAELYVRDGGGRIRLPALSANAPAEPPLPRFDPTAEARWQLGDTAGAGYAIDPAPGELPMLARQGAVDQPFLSRDPVGFGRVGDEPTESTLPPGDGGRSSVVILPAPTFASAVESPVLGIAPNPGPDPAPNPPINPPAKMLFQSREADAEQQPARPGPRRSADPAPQGESELDPVAVVGTLDLRSGSTTVRAGREHRIVRPRLTIDARMDLATLGSTRLVLQIHLNAAGHVESSQVIRSSGSASVDQIFKVTSYEWWFEPAKTPDGVAVSDRFRFEILIN